MARPIPKNLLPHDVTYEQLTVASRGNVYGSPVAISNVLVRKKIMRSHNSDGYIIIGRAVLVYDYTNSSPNTVVFTMGDRVTFESKKYTVQESDEQPTLQGNHHREIILL